MAAQGTASSFQDTGPHVWGFRPRNCGARQPRREGGFPYRPTFTQPTTASLAPLTGEPLPLDSTLKGRTQLGGGKLEAPGVIGRYAFVVCGRDGIYHLRTVLPGTVSFISAAAATGGAVAAAPLGAGEQRVLHNGDRLLVGSPPSLEVACRVPHRGQRPGGQELLAVPPSASTAERDTAKLVRSAAENAEVIQHLIAGKVGWEKQESLRAIRAAQEAFIGVALGAQPRHRSSKSSRSRLRQESCANSLSTPPRNGDGRQHRTSTTPPKRNAVSRVSQHSKATAPHCRRSANVNTLPKLPFARRDAWQTMSSARLAVVKAAAAEPPLQPPRVATLTMGRERAATTSPRAGRERAGAAAAGAAVGAAVGAAAGSQTRHSADR